ncbi:MAG: hypothetical protein J6Z23_07280 [Lachnospiraceae bacterium]|nr:hypothetical protein [Lachnospiraceae bacterium]
MFGYLTAYTDKLSEGDRETYRAYYCGLCEALRRNAGRRAQTVLAYDLVFLALLYNGLYEEPESVRTRLCAYRFRRVPSADAPSLSYAADVNLLLAWHNLRDRVYDSGSRKAQAALRLLGKAHRAAAGRHPGKEAALEAYLSALHTLEEAREGNPDAAANLTGRMLETVFLRGEDAYAGYLRPLFFSLGKFIYLADAYDDVTADLASGAYNPYAGIAGEPDFEARVRMHLESVMGDAAAAFECLPLFRHREILRNILYSGVWMRYSKTSAGRRKKTENA